MTETSTLPSIPVGLGVEDINEQQIIIGRLELALLMLNGVSAFSYWSLVGVDLAASLRNLMLTVAIANSFSLLLFGWVYYLLWRSLATRERSEEELRESKERFQLIAQVTNDAIWDWNLLTNAVWWNEGVQTLFGYSASEVGTDATWWYEHIHAEDRQRVVAGIHAAIASGESFWSCEYRYYRADGSVAHVSNRGYVIRDDTGRPVRMMGGLKDISDKEQVEKALQESQRLIQQIADTTPSLLYVYDLSKGCNIYANRQCEEFFGCTQAEIQAMGWQFVPEFLHPEEVQPLAQSMARFATAKEGEVLEKELRLKNAKGEWRWVHNREVVFTRTPEGNPEKILGIAIDLTQRQQLEASLAASEERFRTSIENMLDSFGIYRAIRDESGQIVDFSIEYLNAAACASNYMTKEQQVGQRLCQLLPVHCETGLFEEYCQLVETGQPLVKESVSYEHTYKGQHLRRAFDIRAVKLGDGFACAWRDITVRKQALEALQASEERLRTALEAAHMVTWDWNIITGQITWSENFQAFVGIERGSLYDNNESFIAIIYPEDRHRVLQKVGGVLQEGGNYKDEFRIILPNGNIRWLASQGQVFYDATGRPVRMTGINLDVTERKLSEEARRKTEELYRTLASNFPNGVVSLFDKDLRYTLTEGQGLAEAGFSKEWIEGKTLWEIFPPEVCEIKERAYRAALDGNPNVCEIPFTDQLYLMYVLPVRNERGEIYAGMSMSQDISDRKRAELALLEERNFISAILDTAGAIIMVYDRQGKTIRVNRACEQITGYSWDEIKGRDFWELFLIPEDIESVKAIFQELQAGQFPIDHENYWVMRDGSRRLLSWSNTVLLDADGSVKYIISIGIDITDRKRAEETRRALETEQELSQLRLRFFSMASHEFRTPLSTILMSTQILESSAHQWSEEKRLRNLRRIESAAKSMKQMIDDILTINRAETRKLEFNPKPLNLEQFCQHLVEEMQLHAGSRHNLNFFSQCECKKVCLDEKLLRSILTNLLSNAIKYSPQGGDIHLALTSEKGEVTFQIRDRGIGISPSDQSYLFEAFHRGGNIESIPGSGLGLTVVKKCVEVHGGSISVMSEVGVGTRFTVTIPLRGSRELRPSPEGLGA